MQSEFREAFAWAESRGENRAFRFAGATQRGHSWSHENNQDALALVETKDAIVAVVADGCSSAPDGYSSHNEVGAKIISKLASQKASDALSTRGVRHFVANFDKFSMGFYNALRQILDRMNSGANREAFIRSYFATTILCLVADEQEYVIFGCGDGLVLVDGRVIDLSSESGRYMAVDLLGAGPGVLTDLGSLKIHERGPISNVRTFMIATDGFEEFVHSGHGVLEAWAKQPHSSAESFSDFGYCPATLGSFHKNVRSDKKLQALWDEQFHDDRTFLLVENRGGSISAVSPTDDVKKGLAENWSGADYVELAHKHPSPEQSGMQAAEVSGPAPRDDWVGYRENLVNGFVAEHGQSKDLGSDATADDESRKPKPAQQEGRSGAEDVYRRDPKTKNNTSTKNGQSSTRRSE